jgi:hypothetical protein
MANVCTNKLFISTGDKQLLKALAGKLETTFTCQEINRAEEDGFCEMDFDSRWVFPAQEMENLTASLPEGNDLYIRVLSYEFGQDYVAYHTYTSGEWCDKLADK